MVQSDQLFIRQQYDISLHWHREPSCDILSEQFIFMISLIVGEFDNRRFKNYTEYKVQKRFVRILS